MKQKTFRCGCKLRPAVHLVPVNERAQHEQELANLMEQLTTPPTAAAPSQVSKLNNVLIPF